MGYQTSLPYKDYIHFYEPELYSLPVSLRDLNVMNQLFLSSLLVASAYAHGVLLMTKGANGVNAPGACGEFLSP